MTKKIKCLITAGPTREHFDPVRFISNPSTGKMGWNIALAAQKKGWDTTLVLGPSELPNIDGVNVINVLDDGEGRIEQEGYLGLFVTGTTMNLTTN